MTNKDRLLKEQKKLQTGDWYAGIVLPGNNNIIVSGYFFHGQILKLYRVKYESNFYNDGGIRLVFDKGKLTVDVYVEYFDRARSIILNCISLYKYVNKVVFEVIGPKGGVKRYSEKLLNGEEEKGFSLLNPYR